MILSEDGGVLANRSDRRTKRRLGDIFSLMDYVTVLLNFTLCSMRDGIERQL
jgi:hypothetical protein